MDKELMDIISTRKEQMKPASFTKQISKICRKAIRKFYD